jgi:tetratricopeptide (TPR) repeat protein
MSDPAATSTGAQSPLVDAQHPWLGLLPLKEEHAKFFFGRDAEIAEILVRIRENTLTILFGQSGLGKTSLLGAAVVPRLAAAHFTPVLVRLDYANGAPSLLEQTRDAFRRAMPGIAWPEDAPAITLWELFHRLPALLPAGSPAPALIIDQFEEIFTLGRQEPDREPEAELWLEQMADLLQNRPPRTLEERFAESRRLARDYDFGSSRLRVVFALREDYLSQLESWKTRLPLLTQNRMALLPLDGGQALEAVVGPASLGERPLVSREVAADIVRTVARVGPETPLPQIHAMPPLLSLLCEQLNAARLAAGVPEITAGMVTGQAQDILQRFYVESYASFPPKHREAIRALIEDPPMITEGGYRNSLVREDAEAHLARLGVPDPRAIFDTLIRRRVITVEEKDRVPRLEITHDVLVPLLVRSRKERENVIARQRFRRKAGAVLFFALLAMLLVCTALMTYAYQTRQKIKLRELLDTGNSMFAAGDNLAALEKYKEAARLKPSEADVWFGIGDALVGQVYGSSESRRTALLSEAIEAYNKAIEIEKSKNATAPQRDAGRAKLAGAYVGLGNVYTVGDDPDFSKAAAFYKQAEATDPESPEPHVGYGNIHREQGHFHLAMDQYEAALKAARQRDTPNHGAHIGLGDVYFKLGHYGLAIDELNRAIGAYPGSDNARFRLACAIYMNDHNDPRVVELFKSLIGSNMKRLDSLSRMNLAYILLEKAEPPIEAPLLGEAVRYLEEAYERDPYAFSAFRLGIGRALQGNPQEASRLWDETAKLPWGGDSLSRRTYSPILATLRSEPGCLAHVQKMTQFLAQEGALGFLEAVKRDAELIRTSELYNAEISPVITLLNEAISQAREHNKLPAGDLEPRNSPPP